MFDEVQLLFGQDRKKFEYSLGHYVYLGHDPSLVCTVPLHCTLTRFPQKTQECLLAKKKKKNVVFSCHKQGNSLGKDILSQHCEGSG